MKLLRWDYARALCELRWPRVPLIVAVLVLGLAEIHRFFPSIPVPVEAKLMYGSVLMVLVGQLIFSIFCPSEVRKFRDAADYVKNNQEIYERSQIAHKFEVVLAQLDPNEPEMAELAKRREWLEMRVQAEKELLQKGDALPSDPHLEESVNRLYPMCVQRHLVRTYEHALHRNWGAILAAIALGGGGTLLASYLVIKRSILILSS